MQVSLHLRRRLMRKHWKSCPPKNNPTRCFPPRCRQPLTSFKWSSLHRSCRLARVLLYAHAQPLLVRARAASVPRDNMRQSRGVTGEQRNGLDCSCANDCSIAVSLYRIYGLLRRPGQAQKSRKPRPAEVTFPLVIKKSIMASAVCATMNFIFNITR